LSAVSNEPRSLRSYAKHRQANKLPGASLSAVQKAIESGRLSHSVVTIDGVAKITNFKLADREWAANTDQTRATDEQKAAAAGQPEARTPVAAPELVQPGDDGDQDNIATASAREKHFRAKLAEIKYLEAAGKLVDAEEVQAAIVDMVTTCRSRLLGIASRTKQRLPHLSLDDINVIDDLVRESLEELAATPTTEA
jgi:phage terminase Nu1 subunit (DNA packaging protein)